MPSDWLIVTYIFSCPFLLWDVVMHIHDVYNFQFSWRLLRLIFLVSIVPCNIELISVNVCIHWFIRVTSCTGF